MRPDLAAHLRLLQSLPVRTHERPIRRDDGRMRHCANHVRAVIVDHRRYDSVTEAARQLDVNRETVRRYVKDGRARYA